MDRLRAWWGKRTRNQRWAIVGVAVFVALLVIGTIGGGATGSPDGDGGGGDGAATRDASAIQAAYDDVHEVWPEAIVDYSYNAESDVLYLHAGPLLADAPAADMIACDYAQPALEAHDLADLDFAITSPNGDVLVSGDEC